MPPDSRKIRVTTSQPLRISWPLPISEGAQATQPMAEILRNRVIRTGCGACQTLVFSGLVLERCMEAKPEREQNGLLL